MQNKFLYLLLAILLLPLVLHSQQKDSPEIGLVLEGGGALGLAHIGVLQVLEELEITIDRIGGTSIGGLVGGLHAVGYTPRQLEQIAVEMDWEVMMGNAIDRAKAPFAIKNESDRFIFSVSRNGADVSLEGALVNGTNIYQKIQELCAPALDVRDFEQLNIPFFCIAADLEQEDQVIFDKGYLPDALRSTMSIPVIFNPVNIDGMLLVDGGLFNNFPVREMRDKGADIVIGVRLVAFDTLAETKGLINVIGKTYEVVMDKVRCEYEYDPDIEIEVLLPGLSASDFDRVEDFIKLGREATERKIEDLKKLKRDNYIKKEVLSFEDQTLKLNQIIITGNNHLKKDKIEKILQLPLNESIHFSDIQNATEKLQATNLFETIRYQINKENNTNALHIYVEEKSGDFYNIGLRYDNDFGASLLLNSTFRNTFKGDDYASVELRLNRSSYFSGEYIYQALREYSPFISTTLKGYDYFDYFSENDYNIFQHNQLELRGGMLWTPNNNLQLKAGAEWQWYGFNENADHVIFDPLNKHLFNYFTDIFIDKVNKSSHPTNGYRSFISLKYISQLDNAKNHGWLAMGHQQFIPVSNKITASLSGQIGLSSNFIDRQFLFYQGGLSNHLRPELIPQSGTPLMKYKGENTAAIGTEIHFEIFRSHHISTGYSISTLNDSATDLLNGSWKHGIFIGYHVSTIIGPINLRIGFPLDEFDAHFFVSIGHFF